MKRFPRKYALINWPWYLRWTIGAVLFAVGILPVAFAMSLADAGRVAWRSIGESDGAHLAGAALFAVLFGDPDRKS